MYNHDRPDVSRGFGFVTFDAQAPMHAAIEGLHNQEWNGKKVSVRSARARPDPAKQHLSAPRAVGSSAPVVSPTSHPSGNMASRLCHSLTLASSPSSADAKKVFVGGISFNTTDESLRNAFERFGPITDARVMMDAATQKSRGFAFVTFDHVEVPG